jgi:hypothetical protein
VSDPFAVRLAGLAAMTLAATGPVACARFTGQKAATAAAPSAIPVKVAEGCSDKQRGEWQFVRDHQDGVRARGKDEWEWVGVTAATDGFHDWAPLDRVKTTICGTLAHFKTFEPNRQHFLLASLPELPEHDWNIFIKPTPTTVFAERFTLATQLMERGRQGDLMKCPGPDDPCFEAELTAPAALRQANVAKEWLSVFRRGQPICVYGPWVGDGGHGYRPEIHPAERVWWRAGDRLMLVFAQDASQRFGNHRHFRWRGDKEEGWQPWARHGLEGAFRVAVDLPASSAEPAAIRIEQLLEGNTRSVKEAVPGDVREVSQHDLEFDFQRDGTSVRKLKVSLGVGPDSDRLALALDNLGVLPVDLCQQGGSIRGFLQIRHRIGQRQEDGEGFDVLEVSAEPPRILGKASTPPPGPARPPADLRVHVEVTAREHGDQPLGGASDALLDALLRAAAASVPGSPGAPSAEAQLTDADVARVSGRKPAQLPLGRTGGFSVSAQPHYDGPRGDRINRAFEKGRREEFQRLLQAANAPMPARVAWKWDLRDFTERSDEHDGVEVPESELSITCRERRLQDDTCEVLLPPRLADHVLRLVATATIETADGASRQMRQAPERAGAAEGELLENQRVRLASHFVLADSRPDADTVLTWLSLSYEQPRILTLAKEDNEPLADVGLDEYRRSYRARMLRQGLILSTIDHRITVDELTQFVRMTREFGTLPPLGPARAPVTAK